VAIHELGATTRDGLGVLLSRSLARARTRERASQFEVEPISATQRIERIEAVARILDVALDAVAAGTRIFVEGPSPRPGVPAGWHYLPSEDGIGVLAPERAFASDEPEVDTDEECDFEEVVAAAVAALDNDHPASALSILRDAMFSNEGMDVSELVPPMQRAYAMLGRVACRPARPPLRIGPIEDRAEPSLAVTDQQPRLT
jgi:hypothetical protein